MSVQYPYLPTLTDAATILNVACASDTDPAAVAADVMRVRSLLASVEYTIAEARPALTVAEVLRDYCNDPETLAEVRAWRDRYDFADVSELPTDDDDGDPAWEIVAGGSSRYEVRTLPRYDVVHVGGAGKLAAWRVVDWSESGDDADVSDAVEALGYDPDAVGWNEAEARALAAWLTDNAPGPYVLVGHVVWDTSTNEPADRSRRGTLADAGHENYDVTDEDDATSAAEAANLRDYEESACGWPFAHNYAAKINEYDAERFAAAGFVVARYRGGELYAGIDGGGYDFTEAHWLPVFLAAQVAHGRGYVRTSGGVRVVVA